MDPDPGHSHKTVHRNQDFFIYLCFLMEGSGSVQTITDPDTEGPKIPDPEH